MQTNVYCTVVLKNIYIHAEVAYRVLQKELYKFES
jgi:hypothetical protein